MEFSSLKIGKYEIKIPVIQGGMGLGISWDRLAGTVSANGALGVISSVGTGCYEDGKYADKLVENKPFDAINFYSTRAFAKIIENARKICGNAPLGANIMCASNDYGRIVKDACEHGINIIISGAGLPTALPEFAREFKEVALVPIVSSAKALKIICKRWLRFDRLPDAVIVEGPKSGGHQGFDYEDCFKEEFQLENLLPTIVKEAKEWEKVAGRAIPVIAAGGVWDKSDIESMMSLGASGVQMATRFIGTYECDAHENFKKVLLNCTEEDIRLISSPVGYPARSVRTNLQRLIEERIAPKIKCIANCVAPCERGKGAKKVGYCIAERLLDAYKGREQAGLFFTGANGYRLKEIISVKELLRKLVNGE